MSVRAAGFDLGETLAHDAGLPVQGQARYPEALACLAGASDRPLTAAEADAGASVLCRYKKTYAVYPNALPALRVLRAGCLRVGVLTDVPYGMPRRFVGRDLAPVAAWVDAVLTSVEVGRRKPHPDGFLLLAARLGVPPSELLYVGNEKDIVGTDADVSDGTARRGVRPKRAERREQTWTTRGCPSRSSS